MLELEFCDEIWMEFLPKWIVEWVVVEIEEWYEIWDMSLDFLV